MDLPRVAAVLEPSPHPSTQGWPGCPRGKGGQGNPGPCLANERRIRSPLRSRALSSGWDQFLATQDLGPMGRLYLHLACLPTPSEFPAVSDTLLPSSTFHPWALPGHSGASVPCCSSVLPVPAWAGVAPLPAWGLAPRSHYSASDSRGFLTPGFVVAMESGGEEGPLLSITEKF